MNSVIEAIHKLLTSFNNGKDKNNNFIPSLNSLYDYLNSMTLLEEASLLHILLFSVIILTMINLLITLFSNEILKYFTIEQKYLSLNTFLKLRMKYLKYYIIWNVSTLFIICIGGICINILAVYSLHR